MSSSSEDYECEQRDLVAPYVLAALSYGETELMKAHLPTCVECQDERQALAPLTNVLTAWRAQALPPPMPLWDSLAERIASLTQQTTGPAAASTTSIAHGWPEPQWKEVAAGITCKLLSNDVDADRVSMLVRLSGGASYPPHQHASLEELYLLEGELWIDDKKLSPGDYHRAEPGTADRRVWSPTGCMCLLITSPSDQLR